MMRFKSLAHARAVRDRLAEQAIARGADSKLIDSLCCAPQGFYLRLAIIDQELANAVEYIAATEKAAIVKAETIAAHSSKAETGIPMKRWWIEEGKREGVSEHAIAQRIHKGKYPNLRVRRVNSRVVFVLP
jgi:hypothetical protein